MSNGVTFLLQKTIDLSIEISPEQVASFFSTMDSEDQAIFFSEVARISGLWKNDIIFQLQYVTDSENLTDEGRELMVKIGEYGPKL